MNGYRLFFSITDARDGMRTGMLDIPKPPVPLNEGVLRDVEAVIMDKFDAVDAFIHAVRPARVRSTIFYLDGIEA